jgi:hypothetical protein
MQALIAFASALTLLPRPTKALCVAFPWLIGIGFVMVYGYTFIFPIFDVIYLLFNLLSKKIKYKNQNEGYIQN